MLPFGARSVLGVSMLLGVGGTDGRVVSERPRARLLGWWGAEGQGLSARTGPRCGGARRRNATSRPFAWAVTSNRVSSATFCRKAIRLALATARKRLPR